MAKIQIIYTYVPVFMSKDYITMQGRKEEGREKGREGDKEGGVWKGCL